MPLPVSRQGGRSGGTIHPRPARDLTEHLTRNNHASQISIHVTTPHPLRHPHRVTTQRSHLRPQHHELFPLLRQPLAVTGTPQRDRTLQGTEQLGLSDTTAGVRAAGHTTNLHRTDVRVEQE